MTEPLPFSGAGAPLSATGLVRAAQALDCEAAVIDAVLRVETGGAGGFLADGSGRPRILFEAHLFSRATGGRYNTSHPDISSPSWNRALYLGGAAEYGRLARAVALDRGAAMKSASWGLFQILGRNHVPAGFRAVDYFVSAMATGEDAQLAAFTSFCNSEGLAAYLRARAWAAFARRYNGPQFAENRYADKLELAYQARSAQPRRQRLRLARTDPGQSCGWAIAARPCLGSSWCCAATASHTFWSTASWAAPPRKH